MSDVYCSATLKKKTKQRLILLQSPHLLLLLCLFYTGPEECWAGSDVLTCPGVGGDSVSELAATSGGGLGDERGAHFREAGAGSSLIPSTSIQMPFV